MRFSTIFITEFFSFFPFSHPSGVYGVEEFTVFKVLKKIIHDTTFASLVEGHQKLLANAIFEAKNHYGKRV
jgi:hypothetical protein